MTTIHEIQTMPTAQGANGSAPEVQPAPPSRPDQRQRRGFHPTRRMAEVLLVLVLGVAGTLLVGIGQSAQSTVTSQLVTQGLRFPTTSQTFNATLFPAAAGDAGRLVTSGHWPRPTPIESVQVSR